jgi:hypothetical protein
VSCPLDSGAGRPDGHAETSTSISATASIPAVSTFSDSIPEPCKKSLLVTPTVLPASQATFSTK